MWSTFVKKEKTPWDPAKPFVTRGIVKSRYALLYNDSTYIGHAENTPLCMPGLARKFRFQVVFESDPR